MPLNLTPEQKAQLVHAVVDGILETVKAGGPLGVPGGHIYAILMTFGISLHQFEIIMSTLVETGQLRREGLLYFTLEAPKCH